MLSPQTDFCVHPEQLFGILFSFLLRKAVSFNLEEALLLWKLIKIYHPLTYRATLVARTLLKHLPFAFQPRFLNAHHWRYLQRERCRDPAHSRTHVWAVCRRCTALQHLWKYSKDKATTLAAALKSSRCYCMRLFFASELSAEEGHASQACSPKHPSRRVHVCTDAPARAPFQREAEASECDFTNLTRSSCSEDNRLRRSRVLRDHDFGSLCRDM